MVKVIALIKSRPELPRDEFLRYWHVEHPPYVRQLPGVRRYRQNHAILHRNDWPYDGAAELWFDSVRDVAIAFDGPAADALRDHEQHFISDLAWFLVDEQEIPLSEDQS